MNFDEAMQALAEMGTAQNRKVYARHGVGKNMFGVSFGNLKELKKKVKKDHALALQLWESGNHDARNFATMTADPKQVTETLLETWVQDLDNYVITDSFVGLISKTEFAHPKAVEWIPSEQEYVARAGWHLLAYLAQNAQTLPDDFFEAYLETIQCEIHHKPNRTREGMNNGLIAIGIRNPALVEKALAVADAIGTVQVDHGETSCKTPFAPDYIDRTIKRKKIQRTMGINETRFRRLQTMYIVHVFVHVKPEFIEAFKTASLDNANNSVQESGVARFDVIQQQDDPTRFVLLEVYRDAEEAPATHKQTKHYARWRDTVAEMMAEPRYAIKYDPIFPGDAGW